MVESLRQARAPSRRHAHLLRARVHWWRTSASRRRSSRTTLRSPSARSAHGETAARRAHPSLHRADELATNRFLRCRQPAVIAAAEKHAGRRLAGPVEVFAEIRAVERTNSDSGPRGPPSCDEHHAPHPRAPPNTRSSPTCAWARRRCCARRCSARAPRAKALIVERGGRAVGLRASSSPRSRPSCAGRACTSRTLVEPAHRGAGNREGAAAQARRPRAGARLRALRVARARLERALDPLLRIARATVMRSGSKWLR
jgi:hypothetical protein